MVLQLFTHGRHWVNPVRAPFSLSLDPSTWFASTVMPKCLSVGSLGLLWYLSQNGDNVLNWKGMSFHLPACIFWAFKQISMIGLFCTAKIFFGHCMQNSCISCLGWSSHLWDWSAPYPLGSLGMMKSAEDGGDHLCQVSIFHLQMKHSRIKMHLNIAIHNAYGIQGLPIYITVWILLIACIFCWPQLIFVFPGKVALSQLIPMPGGNMLGMTVISVTSTLLFMLPVPKVLTKSSLLKHSPPMNALLITSASLPHC